MKVLISEPGWTDAPELSIHSLRMTYLIIKNDCCVFLFKPFIFVQYCQTPHLFAANTRGQAKNSPVFYAIMSPSGILGTLAI